MPEIPQEIRARWRARLAELGPEVLHGELAAVDPEMARSLGPQDGQRVVRALEVFEAAGKSIASFHGRSGVPLVVSGRAEKILLAPERSLLRARIAERAGRMMRHGAVEEVRTLLERRLDERLPVMKAIGVREIAALLEGRLARAEAEERLVAATGQYAKRQMTWFRHQLGPGWNIFEDSKK